MNLTFFILILSAGLLVSHTLLKGSSKRIERSRKLYESASSIEDGIRYKREPVASIIGEDKFSELKGSEDSTVSKLISDICSSDYGAALNCAVLLKNHTEKEMRKTVEKEEKSRPMMAYLPPAAAALVAILLL